MSWKFQLTLILKLHDLFWIINGTYESFKSKNDYKKQGLYHNI